MENVIKVRREIQSAQSSSSQSVNSLKVVKHIRGKPLQSGEKLLAFNVYVRYRKNGNSKSQSIVKTALDVGISQRTLWDVITEMEKSGIISSPKKNKLRLTAYEKLDEIKKKRIRCIVASFFSRNELPTLDKITQAIQEDDALPSLSRTNVWRVLKHFDLNFEGQAQTKKRLILTPFSLVHDDPMFEMTVKEEPLEIVQQEIHIKEEIE